MKDEELLKIGIDRIGNKSASCLPLMAWETPQYSSSEVDSAGKILLKDDAAYKELIFAWTVVNNWRSAHYFPLNTLQNGLRNRVRRAGRGGVIAQRIKRLASIRYKLHLIPRLTLSQIQDIGGCRAILKSLSEARRVLALYQRSSHKHDLLRFDNYVENPKKSGYRSFHVVYSYQSTDINRSIYNFMRIEIQIRSELQHVWATAVETVDAFTRQALKSSQGTKEWLRFFSLMGAVIAMRERTNPVPKTPTERDLLQQELRELYETHDIRTCLNAYNMVVQENIDRTARSIAYRLIVLDLNHKSLSINSYSQDEIGRAFDDYYRQEEEIANVDGVTAVLVSTSSLDQLRRAYPNYFVNISSFMNEVHYALGSKFLEAG